METNTEEINQKLEDQTMLHANFNEGDMSGFVVTFVGAEDGISMSTTINGMDGNMMVYAFADLMTKMTKDSGPNNLTLDELFVAIRSMMDDRED